MQNDFDFDFTPPEVQPKRNVIRVKHICPSADEIRQNLLAVYDRADEFDHLYGEFWYSDANAKCQELAEKYGYSLEIVCGVVAAISPSLKWEWNVDAAETILREYHAGIRDVRKFSLVGTYGKNNRRKCLDILNGTHPLIVLGKRESSGQKVRNFFCNLFDPSNIESVAIDRHAKGAAYGYKTRDTDIVRPNEYPILAECYKTIALELNLKPNQFQAIVWVIWRRLNGILDRQDLPGIRMDSLAESQELESVPF
jgi:hypothetical protein